MFGKLRGLAQGFVRSAVAIGRKAIETYQTLTEAGLGYVKSQFEVDWQTYDQQAAFVSLAMEMPKDQLVSGNLHGESIQNLTCKFKYDVKALYENLQGDTVTMHWSVINDERMTPNEILEYAQMFAVDSAAEGFPMHGPPELEGIWTRAESEL